MTANSIIDKVLSGVNVDQALNEASKPSHRVTIDCTAEMMTSLKSMLETIKTHCGWGASRSWSIDDDEIAEELKSKGLTPSVYFDGDGASHITKIHVEKI
jgi:hypothetical protein